MAEVKIVKYNEKVLVWLHRNNKNMVWLAEQLNQTRQSVSQKLRNNGFTDFDQNIMKRIGIDI